MRLFKIVELYNNVIHGELGLNGTTKMGLITVLYAV